MSIQPGDILLFRQDPDSLISSLIALFEYRGQWNRHNQYTHAGIATSDKTLIESNWTGVRERLIPDSERWRIVRFVPDVPGEVWALVTQSVVQSARQYLGRRYDFANILRLAMAYLFGNPQSKGAFDTRHQLQCAELVCRALAEIGIELEPGHNPEDATPKWLSEKLYQLSD